MKKYIHLNVDDKHLSWGNFCRIVKEYAVNKTSALQIEVFCTIFKIDNINDTTVNNYCVGCRSINNIYKQIFLDYKKMYMRDKLKLVDIIIDLLSIIEGNIYFFDSKKDSLEFINKNKNLKDILKKLYNIGKNDNDVSKDMIDKMNNYINKNNLYELLWEILFFIVLEKKQPIYEEDLKKQVIENILNDTSISSRELEEYLDLKFRDGVNYNYKLKELAMKNNSYACFELGMNEFNGYVMNKPRYDISYDYFYKASISNHPSACYMIGIMYIKGLIGSKKDNDLELGYKYIKKAVDLGNVAGLNILGLMYLRGTYPLEKDINKAINYFTLATKYDYAYGYNNLGYLKEKEKDFKGAFLYYLKSADLGESWACNKVGEFYRKGIIGDKDLRKAFEYYNKAIEGEIRSCCFYAYYNLAKYYYLEGCMDIVKVADRDKAINYLEIAVNGGNILAGIELIYIYCNNYLKSKDEKIKKRIEELVIIIENSSLYDDNLRLKIENKLKEIKHKKEIDMQIIFGK